jgi:hypothetical protein
MIKNLLALFRKQLCKRCFAYTINIGRYPRIAWLRYCVENPSAPACRIYDV